MTDFNVQYVNAWTQRRMFSVGGTISWESSCQNVSQPTNRHTARPHMSALVTATLCLAPLPISLKLMASNRQFIKPLIPLESSQNRPVFFKASFPLHDAPPPPPPFPLFFVSLSPPLSQEPPGVERPAAAPSPPRLLVSSERCAIFHRVCFIGWLLACIWHRWPPLIDEPELPLCISSRSRSFSHPEVISPVK